MATKLNPLQPLVVILNPETFSDYTFSANTYYFYTVELQRPYDNYRVFTGKAWAKQYGYTNNGEITIDISSIAKPYMYSGYDLLKPIYDPIQMEIRANWTAPGTYISGLESLNFLTAGYGCVKTYIHFYQAGTTNISVQNALAVKEISLTSSWNLRSEVYEVDDAFNAQELTSIEFGNTFISHYPKILSENFGVFGLLNVSKQYWSDSGLAHQGTIFKVGNDVTTGIEIKGNYESIYAAGYVPFKLKLSDIVPTLTAWTQEETLVTDIVGGNSSRITQNTILTGTSSSYTVNQIFYAGDSRPHATAVEGFDKSNSVYYIPMNDGARGEGWIRFAELDECYKRYYLVWMTKSCAPVCYGFGGNTVYSEDYSHTTMTNIYNMELSKIQNITKRYELKSGVIDKETYTVMEDIYTSPWCLLYDTQTDKSIYVRPTDGSFTRKNSIREDRQPFTFVVNMQELDKIEILR